MRILENIYYLEYTYRHRQAFRYIMESMAKDICSKDEWEQLKVRAKKHDLDKALLYTLVSKDAASTWHRANSAHHMENAIEHERVDFIEAVIDFECAGYTKPDKPRNAYDTIMDLNPCHKNELLSIVHEMGIAYSYRNTEHDPYFRSYAATLAPYTTENILMEINEYVMQSVAVGDGEAYAVLSAAKEFLLFDKV